MNNKRRKEIQSVISSISNFAETKETIKNIQEQLSSIAFDERDCFDSLTDGLQATFRGQEMEENADALDEQNDALSDAIDQFYDALDDIASELDSIG